MPLFTRSRQLPDTEQAAEENPTPDGSPDDATDDVSDDTAGSGRRGWRAKYPAAAQGVAWATTGLAALLVLFVLLLPNKLVLLTPDAFARIPVEAIFGVALLLVLKPKPRLVAAVAAGVGLGLLALLKLLDMGFYSAYVRPFDLRLDWILLDDAVSFFSDSAGRNAAIAVVIGVVVLAIALPLLTTLAVVRLSRLMARYSAEAAPATLVVGTVWVACSALGVQSLGTQPVASTDAADLVHNRAIQVRAGIKEDRALAKEAAVDAFGDTPADQLLTGLRGKDVIFAFVESYGRTALESPEMGPQVGAMLASGNDRLEAAGFSSRSAFLTSPTVGGGSWLAHSTLASGLWLKNQQRYENVTASDRLSLTGAFQRADAWRTVGIMPGVTRAWPEGKFYGFDKIYNSKQLGYQGPKFAWSPVPDQYSMAAFERLENSKPGRGPLMAEIILVTSHNPWAPLPKTIGWDEIGDGSVYDSIIEEGESTAEVWKDPAKVRNEYRRSIEYSVGTLIDYVEKYGNDDTVLVFLGDHEPVPLVTENSPSRDVPISIVAHDPAVLDQIKGWKWEEGLKPSPTAPVLRMDKFRDRFLTAYGPQSGPAPAIKP
ncbi:sulfatase [Streptomyces sp. NPDC052236]|uniref:sulfatase n=1 Tax=Streptomyces sp. NPDC052236 TaxID=3365686 RepID=UPI0037D8DFD3